jgi:Putative peptidoglycan binding domain/PLD-like domain
MIGANHAISHNKVIVIDGEIIITGSFNFTKAAQEKNAVNLLIIRDPALAAQYTRTGTPIGGTASRMSAGGCISDGGGRMKLKQRHLRLVRGVIGGLPLLLLTTCVASHTGEHPAGRSSAFTPGAELPAVDRLLTRGEIQVAETHLRDFGFDPGPVDGRYTAETQAAVRGYQARYGLPVSGLLDYTTRLQLLPGLDSQHVTR